MSALILAVLTVFLSPVSQSPVDPCAAVAAQLAATRDYVSTMRPCLGAEDSPAVDSILN